MWGHTKQRAANTTLHGMLHPTIMYKNLFNLNSVKMSFVLFGTLSQSVQSVQCCDATFILDDIIIFILPPFVIFKLRKTDQYPNEDSPQSTEMPVGPALEEEEEDGDQCKGGNRCILVFLV